MSNNSKSESDNIDDVLNDTDESNNLTNNESNIDGLDINADTPTMNQQLDNHVNKTNDKIKDKAAGPAKVCQIDKNCLKAIIVEWLALDDQIKSYRETIKDMTDEKKQFENQILELMGALEQDTIITDKGNLTRNVKESKSPLTPDLIKATLAEILKCQQTADTYTNQIMEKRTTKETVSLKRNNGEKKSKGKKNNNPNNTTAKKKQSRKKKNNDEALDV
jgi:hypothetical protein